MSLSYTMRGMEMTFNGQPLALEENCGQNNDCMIWAPRNGFTITDIWNANPEGPFKQIVANIPSKKVILGGRASWRELLSSFGKAFQRTARTLRKFPLVKADE